jgi:hypothetical protein
MSQQPDIDGVLLQWGDRLFYPGNLRQAPQVMATHRRRGGAS